MKLMIFGGTGQLALDIQSEAQTAGHTVVALSHEAADVTDQEAVQRIIAAEAPDVLINTAALHNVEACEQNPGASFQINALGARNVALAAAEADIPVAYISTDYVFDGEKGAPYAETDLPRPLNIYGNSKLSGELLTQAAAPKHFVVRVSALFGVHPCRAKGGRNFVTTMLALAAERDEVRVVTDEIVSPTHTLDIARQVLKLTETDAYGLYHCSSQGACSWHDFAKAIFDLTRADVKLSAASAEDFPAKVARPLYSVMENTALQSRGLDIMPSWEDGLKEYLKLLNLPAA